MPPITNSGGMAEFSFPASAAARFIHVRLTRGDLVAEEHGRVAHHAAAQRQPSLLPARQPAHVEAPRQLPPDAHVLLALQPRTPQQPLGLGPLGGRIYRPRHPHVRPESMASITVEEAWKLSSCIT